MNIEQVKELREKLEQDIFMLLKDFECATGARPQLVHLRTSRVEGVDVLVSVKLDVLI